MKKSSSSFVCQECGYDSPKFLGKCPECGEWNTLKEIRNVAFPSSAYALTEAKTQAIPRKLHEINPSQKERIQSGFSELDTVLGGEEGKSGFVRGGVTLLAGDPGIGKSTLLLQLALQLSTGKKTGVSTVLYISGEESEEQIKLRAVRLTKGKQNDSLLLLSLSNTDAAITVIMDTKPDFVIVDSIQTMESTNVSGLSGSVGQVRYAAIQYIRVAKTNNIPLVMVGHVTKEGMVAGPMVLSHMVDTVLFLEGEKFTATRMLRSLKNRFGPVDEVGIFLMTEEGMREATNPEEVFLTGERLTAPGSVLVATLEGTRAFLVEVQALCVSSKLPMPRRVVSGIDPKRVELLLAVLQKHGRLPVESMDVFVSVAGGLRITDPGADLGICLAIFSSIKNISLPKTVGIAEVGLLGELRNVPSLEKRVKEAQKLGFDDVITPKAVKTLMEVLTRVGR